MNRVVEIEDLALVEEVKPPPPPQIFAATMRWARSKLTIGEGTTNQPLVLILSRALPFEIYVQFEIQGTSTAVPADYTFSLASPPAGTPAGTFIRIPAGSLTGFCNITVPNEGAIEGTEFLDLIALTYEAVYQDIQVVITGELDAGTFIRLVLTDNPVAPPGSVFWSFESDAYAFNEDAPPSSTRVRVNFSDKTPEDVQMRFWTTPGTATGGATANTPGADYVNLDASGTIPAGSTTFTIPLQIINDATPEPAESFTLHGEVLTPGSLIVDGVTTTTAITINESDQTIPTVLARWEGENTPGTNVVSVTVVEAGTARRLRILLSAIATQNLFIPVSVVPAPGSDLQRIGLAFFGGVYGTAVVPAGYNFTDIILTVPNRVGVQATMTYELTIGSATGVQPGEPRTLEIIVLDMGVTLPEVSFRDLTQPLINEGSASDLLIPVDVTNASVADLSQGFTVDLAYSSSGGAVYGDDFRIFQLVGGSIVESPSRITFAPNETVKVLRLRPTNDTDDEPDEQYGITLTNPAGCTIGAVPTTTGTIVDDDGAPSGEDLRPEFYFASEVLGKGPNVLGGNNVNLIVDLGTTFPDNVLIDVTPYSPNAVEGVDYDFPGPTGKQVVIAAGQRYGKLRFRALGPGVATDLKWVVVEMTNTNYGRLDDFMKRTRWTAVLAGGATLNRGLVPTPYVPPAALDDYEVYADRIEDLYHGDTIPLPFDRTRPTTIANYGAELVSILGAWGGPNDLYNGIGIAAHLAQKVWLDRNNPVGRTFGTHKVFLGGPAHGNVQVHYLDPHVKWLDEGLPVYISVYEQATNGPHNLYFCGEFEQGKNVLPGSVCWGRHFDVPGYPGAKAPSMTRDLFITARGHDHHIKQIQTAAVMPAESTAPNGNTILHGCLTDNIHLHALAFVTDPDNPGASTNTQRTILGRNPPRFLTQQALISGLHYLDSFVWSTTNLATHPVLQFHMRVTNPASWIITRCEATRSWEQFGYFDSTGPIFIMAYNMSDKGTHYSLLQVVSRNPWRTLFPNISNGGFSSGPSHGLLAIVENEHHGVLGQSIASDIEIYGHLGYAFFAGNRHRGDIGYNRRMYTLLASGNNEGQFMADAILCDLASEYIPGSPVNAPEPFFTTRYAEFEDIDIDIAGVGGWNNCALDIAGCWRAVFKAMVNASAVTPMNTAPSIPGAGTPFFVFNSPTSTSPNYAGGAIMADALNRPLIGIGYTSGPVSEFLRFRNRGGLSNAPPGGVSFPDGFDAIATLGNFCGSTRKGDHWRAISPLLAPLAFSSMSPAQRDAYDGTDP